MLCFSVYYKLKGHEILDDREIQVRWMFLMMKSVRIIP